MTLLLILLAVFRGAAASAQVAEEPYTTLVIPLQDGRFYSSRQFYEECQRKLGSQLPSDGLEDHLLELTAQERLALQLAIQTGLLRGRIESDQITLLIPDNEDDRIRRDVRRRLGAALGVALLDWPDEKGLHLPEHFDGQRPTVLLIHGLRSSSDGMHRMVQACEAWGIQPILFDYPNNGPIAWAGDRLSEDLRQLASKHPGMSIVIVAHSMGGLVARYCLETPGKNPSTVRDLFLLGTPNRGSPLAELDEWLWVLGTLLPGKTGFSDSLREGLGEAAVDLRPESRFLARLNARQRPPNVRYHVGLGRKSWIPREQQAELRAQLEHFLQRQESPREVRKRWLAYLGAAEVRDGEGDGAVSIASATLKDAASSRQFDRNHIDLVDVSGGPPEESDVFQWIVHTMGWPRPER